MPIRSSNGQSLQKKQMTTHDAETWINEILNHPGWLYYFPAASAKRERKSVYMVCISYHAGVPALAAKCAFKVSMES